MVKIQIGRMSSPTLPRREVNLPFGVSAAHFTLLPSPFLHRSLPATSALPNARPAAKAFRSVERKRKFLVVAMV